MDRIALNRASPGVAFMGDSIDQGEAFPRPNSGLPGETAASIPRMEFAPVKKGTAYVCLFTAVSVNQNRYHKSVNLGDEL